MNFPHPPLFMMHLPILLLALWLLHRRFVRQRSPLKLDWAAFGFVRLLALIALLGLAGCASTETLAVAQGPLFALNPGHWQPTAKDMGAPQPAANP